MKKFLSILLSIFVVANNTVPVFATNENSDADSSDKYQVELRDLEGNKSPYLKLDASQEAETKDEHKDTDVVRVSIFLDGQSTLEKGYDVETAAFDRGAVSYRNQLEKNQVKVQNSIEKEVGYALDVKWNLTLAANIISANVKYGDIAAIEKVNGVKSVVLEQQYFPVEEEADQPNTAVTTSNMVFATQVWDAGYTGAERLVAIIDTGTNQDHISFQADALEYSLTKDGKALSDYDLLTADKIAAVADQLNAAVDADHNYGYKNTKIPYAYNYVDENYTTDHASDSQGEHGSHVSGISAANRYVSDGNGGFVEAADSVYAVGVAPDAQIVTMKVFGAGGGAYDSDYFAAIEDALVLGADSVNLSLGSSAAGFAFSGSYESILNSLPQNSSVVTISAGNSYAWSNYSNFGGYLQEGDASYHTGGSPGSFTNAFTIASAENIGQIGKPLTFNGSLKSFYTETSNNGGSIANVAGTYDYVYIDGIGNADEYAAVNEVLPLAGKVVITNRGAISFYVKGNNLIPYSPVALVVANNAAGTINMALDDYTGTFPMVSITLADANTLKASDPAGTVTVGETEYAYYTGTVEVSNQAEVGLNKALEDTEMSDFSSWGGAGSLLMKPEITTPGGNIYSVNGMTNDEYELMSGTSMAAPHAAGIAALVAQYVEENDLAKYTNGNARTLVNSLMMSTATPMKNDGRYVSILQQGAGLANTLNAVNAKTFITMDEDATSGAADGKVKVELGDDPSREGKYTYGFTITNMSDEVLSYALSTDIFTQALENDDEGKTYVAPYTVGLNATATYDYDTNDYDVNRDGVTNTDDVQAILDYVTGANDGSTYDLEAAEVDGNEGITSYDAQVLLELLQKGELTLAANESKHVNVTIELADKEALNETFKNGFYVEGFTRVTSTSVSTDGALLDVEHSIPVYGFYGSFTDPSMYDRGTLLDQIYPSDVESYVGNANTNYLTVKYPGSNGTYYFTGNPYVVEDKFPSDRLAISSGSTVVNGAYTLQRNAGTVAPAVVKVDAEGNNEEVLFLGSLAGSVNAPYYSASSGGWANASAQTARFNVAVSDLGVEEGDKLSVGVFAVPEYNAMKRNGSTSGNLTADQFKEALTSGELGDGARMGFTLTVDNTAPEVLSVELNEAKTELTVKAKDNQYIAFVGLTDLDGETTYTYAVPEQTQPGEEVTVVLPVDVETVGNAAAVIVGDYASNEVAKLAILGDGPVTVKRTIYKQVDEIHDGGEYIITDQWYEGPANAMAGVGSFEDVANAKVTIYDREGEYVILNSDAADELVWTANAATNGGYNLINNAIDSGLYALPSMYWLFTYGSGSVWNYEDSALFTSSGYVQFDETTDAWGAYPGSADDADGYVVLYEKSYYLEEIDPTQVQRLEVSPASTEIVGLGKTATLNAVVYPAYIEDKSVTWTSADESVATVDANGVVTAVAEGTTTITATSNLTPSVSATAEVKVLVNRTFNAYVFGQVTDKNGKNFSRIDLRDGSVTPVAESYTTLQGGGRDGNFIYAVDEEGDFDKFTINDDETVSAQTLFQMNMQYAPLDATNWFTLQSTKDGVTYTGVNDMYTFATTRSGYIAMYNDEGNLSGWNFSSMGTFVGIAFAGAGTNEEGIQTAYYYALNATGELYLLAVEGALDTNDAGEIELAETMQRGTLGVVEGLSLTGDVADYSLSYVGYQTDEEQLLLVDNSTKRVYVVNIDLSAGTASAEFISQLDVESVSTLFNNDYDTVNAVGSEKYAHVGLQSVAAPLEVVNVAVAAGAAEVAGTTNGMRGYHANNKVTAVGPTVFAPEASLTVEADEENKQSVTYTESLDTKSGLVTVTYDPAKATFVGVDTDTEFHSVHDEAGVIKFAYAGLEAVSAGNTIAKFNFVVCEDSDVTVTVNERTEELGLNEETTASLEGEGHDWNLVGFEWNEDHTGAVANFECGNNEEHKTSVDATVTIKEVDGKRIYTATVELDGKTYTDTYEELIETPNKPGKPGKGSKTGDRFPVAAVGGFGLAVLAVVLAAFFKKKVSE